MEFIWFVCCPLTQNDGGKFSLPNGQEQDDAWMVEGVFDNEGDAKASCPNNHFIIKAKVNQMMPFQAVDALALYFPNEEKWEESKLYKIKNQDAD